MSILSLISTPLERAQPFFRASFKEKDNYFDPPRLFASQTGGKMPPEDEFPEQLNHAVEIFIGTHHVLRPFAVKSRFVSCIHF